MKPKIIKDYYDNELERMVYIAVPEKWPQDVPKERMKKLIDAGVAEKSAGYPFTEEKTYGYSEASEKTGKLTD